jgi:hypothetical protein
MQRFESIQVTEGMVVATVPQRDSVESRCSSDMTLLWAPHMDATPSERLLGQRGGRMRKGKIKELAPNRRQRAGTLEQDVEARTGVKEPGAM